VIAIALIADDLVQAIALGSHRFDLLGIERVDS
jgi:hypothetical protein